MYDIFLKHIPIYIYLPFHFLLPFPLVSDFKYAFSICFNSVVAQTNVCEEHPAAMAFTISKETRRDE